MLLARIAREGVSVRGEGPGQGPCCLRATVVRAVSWKKGGFESGRDIKGSRCGKGKLRPGVAVWCFTGPVEVLRESNVVPYVTGFLLAPTLYVIGLNSMGRCIKKNTCDSF